MVVSRVASVVVRVSMLVGCGSAAILAAQLWTEARAQCTGGPNTYMNNACFVNVGVVACPNEDDCLGAWGYQCAQGGIRHNQRYCVTSSGFTCIYQWSCNCGAKLNCNGVPVGGNCVDQYENC